jgi:hypothetical protein
MRQSKKRLKEIAEKLAKEKKVKEAAAKDYEDSHKTKKDAEYEEWHSKHILRKPPKMRKAEHPDPATDSDMRKRYGGGKKEYLERMARVSEIQRKARKAAEEKKKKK